MSIRLFPDVIVAAEINNMLTYEPERQTIEISVGDCLSRQEDYTRFGIPNVFIGFESRHWTADDYIDYFESLPRYFSQVGYELYTLNLENLRADAPEPKTDNLYWKLFTQGSYNRKTLRALGIYRRD